MTFAFSTCAQSGTTVVSKAAFGDLSPRNQRHLSHTRRAKSRKDKKRGEAHSFQLLYKMFYRANTKTKKNKNNFWCSRMMNHDDQYWAIKRKSLF